MSTDFIYEDLENRGIDDDYYVIDGYEKIGNHSCVVLLSKPIRNSAYWGKKIFVDQTLWQIRKIEYFSSESIISKTLFLNEIVNNLEIVRNIYQKSNDKKSYLASIKSTTGNIINDEELISMASLNKEQFST